MIEHCIQCGKIMTKDELEDDKFYCKKCNFRLSKNKQFICRIIIGERGYGMSSYSMKEMVKTLSSK